MRKLAMIPGFIFGLIFAGGGFFFLAQTSVPTWQNWYEMQSWRPGYAQLLSASGSENETRASYRYEYGGESFLSTRVYPSDLKDNIGSYHADLIQQLRRYQQSGEPLPIWINPREPGQAVIDRDMRWGLFALMIAFCSVFILIGLGVIYGSVHSINKSSQKQRPSLLALRKEWKEKQQDPNFNHSFLEFSQYRMEEMQQAAATEADISNWQSRKGWENSRITSEAKSGVWFFWIFAILWNAVSIPIAFIVPAEIRDDNYAALIALIFPLVGAFLFYKAIASTLEYRYFGKVIFDMDPYPGAIGGHVGGKIQVARLEYRQAVEASELSVSLECVYSYMSGSGKNRSRRETIKWAEQGKPKVESRGHGVNLSFRFDVPDGLPNADIEQKNAYHFWRLSVKADVRGVDLNRHYNIPVFATGETSHFVKHDVSAQSAALKARESEAARIAISSGNFDIQGLSDAMTLETRGNEIHLRFPMFRNKMLTIFAAIFAGGFGFASYSMAGMVAKGGLFGIFIAIFGLPFFLVALLAGIASIYLPLNNLQVSISTEGVKIMRRLLFVPIFKRNLSRGEITHLSIKRSGSTGQGINKIEHFKLKIHDRQGRTATIAEGIDGENIAAHFRDYLAQRLAVESRR